jgi:hypothetical protein
LQQFKEEVCIMRNAINRITIIFSLVVSLSGLGVIQQSVFAQQKCPCDIFKDCGTPCVAAHSTVRALYNAYEGPLYQVRLKSDTTKKKDIYPLTPGGYANAAAVDSFLKGTTGGTVSKIYDQSGKNNHLTVSLWGSARPYPERETPATRFKDTISGHIVYPLLTDTGEGYRNNHTNGVATGAQTEGMYCVVKGGNHPKKVGSDCCWDYGNAESDADAGGKKTGVMEALYFGSNCWFSPCNGSGPWFFADLEWGLFHGAADSSIFYKYAAGYLKGTTTTYTLRSADATKTFLPNPGSVKRPAPNILTGAIVLGIGGDSAPSGWGYFYEGAMTFGTPPDSAENLVHKNLAYVYSGKDTVQPPDAIRRVAQTPAASQFKVRYNPTNSSAIISYAMPEVGHVRLNVYNQQGRSVAGLVNHVMTAGLHEAIWNTKCIPTGVYICKISIDGRDAGAGEIVLHR